MTFVIMGATGQTGGIVLNHLRQRGLPVRAITRDPARAAGLQGPGVEVVRGDASDAQSLAAAFTGADAVYVLNVPQPGAAAVLAEAKKASAAIAEAVRRAKVRHVVALSSSGAHLAEGSGVIRSLHDLEAALRGAAPSITFIRATYFMENWAAMLPVAREQGVLPSLRQPIDAPGEIVSAADVGATAAACLLEPRDGERIINLIGPAEYSSQDAAKALSEVLGRPVEAVALPREAWVPTLTGAGLGADYAGEVAQMYDGINAGHVGFEPGVGETRRGTVTLADALRAVAAR